MSLTLNLPSTSLAASRPVARVEAHPLVLASVLDAHLRRTDGQDRVFGTLLGVRRDTDNVVEVRNAFAVPYEVRTRGQVTIDLDHHRAMLDLHLKVNPREVVVGWYASSPHLNSFSALIHNFYANEAAPHPAVHLTLDPASLAFAAYTAAPLGLATAPGAHLAFLPVDAGLALPEHERPGLDLLSRNLSSLATALPAPLAPETVAPDYAPQSPLSSLAALLARVADMLDLVLAYVRAVESGEQQGDEKVGRALLETVGNVPSASAKAQTGAEEDKDSGAVAAKDGEKKDFEEEFNAHLADVLMVSYLANVVKTQAELSSRLNLVV
ncbi:hypothetical protein JCM10450v2_001500 [Rhodotorula kratochvilovae]